MAEKDDKGTPARPPRVLPASLQSVWEVLGEEYWRGIDPSLEPEQCGDAAYVTALHQFRQARLEWEQAGKPAEGVLAAARNTADRALRETVIALLYSRPRTALCFSGGGIRSATFGLGVLQGLASHSWSADDPDTPPQLLCEFDYLSTVSGGGYLGGWFSAWASRHPDGTPGVVKALAALPAHECEPEPEPVRHLRRFCNYLNPQLGAFSADTWTLVATVIRNIVLNWLVLLPLLAAALVAPRVVFALVMDFPPIPYDFVLGAAIGLMAAGVAYMVADLPSAGDARYQQSRFLIFGLIPIGLSTLCFSLFWAWTGTLHNEPGPAFFVGSGVMIMSAGVALGLPVALWKRRAFDPGWVLKGAAFSLLTGAVGGLMVYWMTWRFTDPVTSALYDDRAYAWLSIPSLLGAFCLGQALLVALTSLIATDEDREWWSRATAWILITIVVYFVFSGIVLMTPALARHLPELKWQSLATAIAGFAASTLGLSPKTAATPETEVRRKAGSEATQLAFKLAGQLALPVFLILLAALIATFNERASNWLWDWIQTPPRWSPLPAGFTRDPVLVELALMILMALPALLLSRVIDANKFSLHAMYRARLVRTFLGASTCRRRPNPFTGFDAADNVPLANLPPRPLHVVNATLNLVKGENLAWQQRKAESFTASRYHCGSCQLGYQDSRIYAGGATLGGAITISGAAANPNMGYVTSPLLSIVMMLFNARLGAWLPNPGVSGRGVWSKSGPTYSVRPFIDEAFGLTDDVNPWVNLSDGGHFENLGLYEMVLRRCRTIVVVDGSADPCFAFDDLGNAIRKIRVDMGIPIEFENRFSIAKEVTPGSKHCSLARIRYTALDPEGIDGTLLYIKSCLTGNEPRDVLNYAALNPAFPHQSTGDQWFDESQFESYRRLGYHVVEEIFQFRDQVATLDTFTAAAGNYCACASGAADPEA